jgi:hypothetical protein
MKKNKFKLRNMVAIAIKGFSNPFNTTSYEMRLDVHFKKVKN